MNSFLYKSDSKELWLVMPEPIQPKFEGDYFLHYGPQKKYEEDLLEWNSRLHYTVSPELHELLKDRKDEIKENEFATDSEYFDKDGKKVYNLIKAVTRKTIAIPLPEQTKPIKVRYKCPMCRHWWREKRDHNCLGGYIKMDHVEWETIYPDNNTKQPNMKSEQTNQEAGKQLDAIKAEATEHAQRVIALGWHKNQIKQVIAGAWEAGYIFGTIDESKQQDGLQRWPEAGKQSAEQAATNSEIWPDEVRLKMIERGEWYDNPKIYYYGYYDGFQHGKEWKSQPAVPASATNFSASNPVKENNYVITGGHVVEPAAPGDDVKSPEEILHKHTGGRDYTIPTLKLAILEYANQLAAPQAVKWVQASERLPEKCGEENRVIVRVDSSVLAAIDIQKPVPSVGKKIVTYGFRNFSEENPKMYFGYGSRTYLSNDLEWLDEGSTDKNE